MQQQAALSTELFGNLECSEFSIMTESILTTSRITMTSNNLTSKAPSEDFFSVSSLIFVLSKGPKRRNR